MPAVKLSPLFNDQAITPAGAPASGYKVYSYAAGSSTPLATYTDSTGAVAQTNPIILNANGFPTNGPIWLQSGLSYKLVFTDSSGNVIKTVDNVSGINDTGSAVSQWGASGVTPTYVSASSFTLSGDQTGEFHVGRRAQFATTAGTVYGIISASVFTTLTTVTVSLDSGVLDSGLSAANLSILRADHSSLPAPDYTGTRNRIINGNFAINQRTYSGTVTLAAGAYGHDRWKAGAAGCTYTFATSGADTVITVTVGSLMQVIEGANIEGGTYRLSHAGTANARIAVNGAATSGSYAANPQTSASATANQNITVEFTTGTISKVQLEPGTTATPFERRPYGQELMLCRRYCRQIANGAESATESIGGGHCFGTGAQIHIPLDTPMRTTPSITYSSLSHFLVENGVSSFTPTSLTIDGNSTARVASLNVNGGTLTAGTATSMRAQSASASMFLSAEL